jgi:hypothetical protein
LDASPYEGELSYYLTGPQDIAVSRDDTKEALQRLLTAVTGFVRGHAAAHVSGGNARAGTASGGKTSAGNTSTDKMLFSAGMKLLGQKKYPEAANTFRQYMEIAPDDAQSHFYWALAVISGRKTRQLDGLVVKRLLGSLEPFLQDPDAGFIKVLLAILKQGYYALNGFKVPAPGVGELLQGVRLDNEKAAALLTHLDELENDVLNYIYDSYGDQKKG